jgi:nitrite reductase/ring-hydroxylating ferredoxin subunit
MADDNDWQRVAAREDIKPGVVFAANLGDTPIALTEIDGAIFAISDTCSHEFALLSEGFLEGDEIECPLHQARFGVRDGKCLMGPATQDIDTYEVKVEGADVLVKVK